MNDLTKWLDEIRAIGELCDWGEKAVSNATSRKRLADAILSAKACGFLCRVERCGHPIPYDLVKEYIPRYINGRYQAHLFASNKTEYTSELYCDFKGNIKTNSTLLTLLGFRGVVNIEDNCVVTIYCDKKSDFVINCPESSIVACEYWGKRPRVSEDSIVAFVKK